MYPVAIIFAITAFLPVWAVGAVVQNPSNKSFYLSRAEIDTLNKKCYDARADYWDRLPFADFLPEAIIKAHNPQNGFKAVDIGSGTGRLALWLAKHGYQVLCLDPSDEMVRRTRFMGFTTQQTTIQEFTTTEKFDLVLAILSLIHVPKSEMPAQLEKISQMLNPEGVFALAMIQGQGEGVAETTSDFPRYFAYYNRQEIMALTRGSFDLIDEVKTPGPISYLVFLFRKHKE